MRRLIYIALLVAVGPWVVIGAVRAAADGDAGGDYRVRAIFDNASALVPGEDVKIAGAPVGVVAEMDVTGDNRAAVTLRIEDEDFIPFKTDASCTIRPQSLIGEKFVECEPGSASAQPLRTIREGDGEGERLLPVSRTSSPVDLDLLSDVMRLPYRERLAIVLNEFGTGLAGRGEELNEAIHRANPALRETERVVRILGKQNRALARLARDADAVLGPLARERRRVSDWIVQAGATAEATAERRADIRLGINRLPGFLRELRPLMADLESFADQGTPLLSDLSAAAPDLSRLIRAQGTLATAGRESLPSLGEALERGRPALIRSRPLIQDLGRLGREARPVSEDLDALTASLDRTGGIERIADFLYYVGLATNGFDSIGHYLRAGLVVNTCSNYTTELAVNCNSNFTGAGAAAAGDALAARNAAEPRAGRGEGSVPSRGTLLQGLVGPVEDPALARERERNLERLRKRAERSSPALGGEEPMLDYLLGGER